MRTTLDLPDSLFRRLKAKAASEGLKLKELLAIYITEGLESKQAIHRSGSLGHADALPVAIPLDKTIPPPVVRSNRELQSLLEAEELNDSGDHVTTEPNRG